MIGNVIRDEGTKAISEALKVNTTLTSLNLGSDEKKQQKVGRKTTTLD